MRLIIVWGTLLIALAGAGPCHADDAIDRGGEGLPACVAPEKKKPVSLSSYRRAAEWLVKKKLSNAAAHPVSIPVEERQCVSWLMASMQQGGVWWQPGNGAGDPNINRFVLMPILDYLYMWSGTGAGKELLISYESRLRDAISFQYGAYHAQVPWDGAGRAAGQYVNQDIYYALIMALSGKLFKADRWDREAARAIRGIERNLMPGGAFFYIGRENESPVYHAYNQVMLARYYQITSDRRALDILRKSAKYWNLVLTQQGHAEAWSDVWWKQSWMPMSLAAIRLSVALSKDPLLAGIEKNLRLTYSPHRDSYELLDAYAKSWDVPDVATRRMPERFMVVDDNSRGVKARHHDWYYGFTQGRGLRNTFVGGLVSLPGSLLPNAVFRGAQIEVFEAKKAKGRHGLWLSQVNDKAAVLMGKNRAALGVSYSLQPSIINGYPYVQTPDSAWHVRQIWVLTGSSIIGGITVRAVREASDVDLIGRIPLGPCEIRRISDAEWQCGQLKIRFFENFSDLKSVGVMPAEFPSQADNWKGILFRKSFPVVSKDQLFRYAVWVGPASERVPDSVRFNDVGSSMSVDSGLPSFFRTDFDDVKGRIEITDN